jgi:transposase
MAMMPPADCLVTVGVDSHKELHVAVALDQLGRRLGACTVATTPRGFGQLERWAQQLGVIQRFGIEGTGSYAAGLARWLAARGHQVVEVNRPNRQTRRRQGKSDPIDAEAAARAVLAGQGLVRPKGADGTVEMLRVLRMARRSAMKARTQTIQQLDSLVVTAPDQLRAKLRRLSLEQLVPVAAGLRPGELADPLAATKLALRELARRHQALSAELARLDQQIARLTASAAPRLLARGGVGPQVATALLIAAGDNPARLRSDAAFSMLCGASPIPASSGKTVRHRLNRGGNRQANTALYRIVVVRLRWHPPTRDYLARRTKEGLSKREIIRCLKRYVAREVFAALQAPTALAATA